jgi:hypothetical protein
MSTREPGVERVGDRCEVCGTTLTSEEVEAALESGGPALCTVHAAEAAAASAVTEEPEADTEE